MVLDATPKFVQISTCCDADGMTTNVFALDDKGCVWQYFNEEQHWGMLYMVYDTEEE